MHSALFVSHHLQINLVSVHDSAECFHALTSLTLGHVGIDIGRGAAIRVTQA